MAISCVIVGVVCLFNAYDDIKAQDNVAAFFLVACATAAFIVAYNLT